MVSLQDAFAKGDYPTSWAGFIGQDQAKKQLLLAARSAKERKAALDHTLLASPPGVGKTALALLIATEMKSTVIPVSGTLNQFGVQMLMSRLTDGDILLYEECHRMAAGGKAKAEWMLNYMQDGTIIGPRGPESAPAVTIVATTTDGGKIPQAIKDRFLLRPQFTAYTDEEAAQVAAKLAARVLPAKVKKPSAANYIELASAGNRNPRAIRRLLHSLRDLAVTGTITSGKNGYNLTEVFAWHGVTPDGLDQTARKYLRALADDFGGQAGERALMDRLQEPGGLAEPEQILIDKELIVKTRTGRMITNAGIARLRKLEMA